MRVLFRNPLLRALMQFWWLPVLGALLLGLARGQAALGWVGVAAYLGLVAGVLGLSWGLVRAAVARERTRHRQAGHRFLCPSCLNTDELRFACPNCRKEIEGGVALAGHLLGAVCPACSHSWSSGKPSPAGLLSFCGHCNVTGEIEVLHERAVHIHGALTGADFDTLCACAETPPERVTGVRCRVQDDGAATVWTFCLEDLTLDQELLPRSHAIHGLSRIWTAETDPLRMGRIIDHLVSRAELSDAHLAGLSVATVASEIDPAAQRLLSTRFGSVERGVSAPQFVGAGLSAPHRPAMTAAASEARETAVLGTGGSQGGS